MSAGTLKLLFSVGLLVAIPVFLWNDLKVIFGIYDEAVTVEVLPVAAAAERDDDEESTWDGYNPYADPKVMHWYNCTYTSYREENENECSTK